MEIDTRTPKIRLSGHSILRFAKRHEREVEMMPDDTKRGVEDTILRDLGKSICWYDNQEEIVYMVYNQLRIYVGKLSDRELHILTEYPYKKNIKRRLNTLMRIENPLDRKEAMA